MMKRVMIIIAAIAAGYAVGVLIGYEPITPAGAFERAAYGLPVNPDVTQENISSTICVPGYSKTVRPPVSYTNRIKVSLMQQEGLPLELIADKVLDHRISISAGGSPDDPRNLILQDHDDSSRKDRFENEMHHKICGGEITLRDAQEALWAWRP